MSTQFIARVRPDHRGRVVITKALDVMRHRFASPISGFEISLTSEGDLLWRPTVEVPAASQVVLSPSAFVELHEVVEAVSEPNEALVAAARAFRADVQSGRLRNADESPKSQEVSLVESERGRRAVPGAVSKRTTKATRARRAPEHIGEHENTEHPDLVIKHGKKRSKR